MNLSELVDEMVQDSIEHFEEDGMTVTMPDDVKLNLKNEMWQRLYDAVNDIRDDIELDVRAHAVMNDEEVA